jgi:hypothetical protein
VAPKSLPEWWSSGLAGSSRDPGHLTTSSAHIRGGSAAANIGSRLWFRQCVNDFSIQVATVNGSGSQTANTVLMRSIFQMGIPVSGKNLFPSNIAGLPTWFTIRASARGYIGRKKEIDFLVAMNPETAREDVMPRWRPAPPWSTTSR